MSGRGWNNQRSYGGRGGTYQKRAYPYQRGYQSGGQSGYQRGGGYQQAGYSSGQKRKYQGPPKPQYTGYNQYEDAGEPYANAPVPQQPTYVAQPAPTYAQQPSQAGQGEVDMHAIMSKLEAMHQSLLELMEGLSQEHEEGHEEGQEETPDQEVMAIE